MTEWIWEADPEQDQDSGTGTLRRTASQIIKDTLYREQPRWFLWFPVGVGLGCAAYFSLRTEPSWVAIFGILIVSATFCFISRKQLLALIFSVFLLAIASGVMLAKISSVLVAAPTIQKRTGPVTIKGWIENSIQQADGSAKIILRPFVIDKLKREALPRKLRLKLRKSQNKNRFFPGETIELKAIIFPPPEPAFPGGYDFSRNAWFKGIGGSGFVTDSPKKISNVYQASLRMKIAAALARTWQEISSRLKTQLPGAAGGVAAALLVGDRAAIPKPVIKTLRDAGLAHLLAISGLHMALVAGTLFWLLRAALALNATLILRLPVKKWAAVGALAGALIYLLISGASIATQRAFIMILIMFLAIMLDRPAITLRNIAIAALVILVIEPISLLSVSFQMSFAATTVLVAFYEWYRTRKIFPLIGFSPGFFRVFYKGIFYITGIALTTLIAGAATSPFAAYYFQRVAVFGLIANVLSLPIIGFIVMPAGLIALIAMPLSLDGFALAIMGLGLEAVIGIAEWTASLPQAVQNVPAFSGNSMALIVFGGLWLCLWQTRLRLFGLVTMIAGFILAPFSPLPDVYVASSGRNIAVRGQDGLLVVARPRGDKFSVTKWLERDGDPATQKVAAQRAGFSCDGEGCAIKLKDNRILAYAQELAAVEEDCRKADILISRIPVHQKCTSPQVVIDKFDVWRNGAYTLSFKGQEIRVENAQDLRGNRPWVRQRKRRSD